MVIHFSTLPKIFLEKSSDRGSEGKNNKKNQKI
jgi:hypothetical protein